MHTRIKAIGLISGGLDSVLAVRVVQEQSIEVIGLSCKHPFHSSSGRTSSDSAERVARQAGIELYKPDVSDTMIELVKDPPHGHGKHLNPCIDCRIMYLREGARLMEEHGAHFLITGEVLGQRPMSQMRDTLDIVERDSGLRGLVLRPLSARLLRPTVPEEKGWVDRERLLSISGRGRKEQMALAEKFGITDYDTPAGGCLLTMEGFVNKVDDLIKHKEKISANDIELLKFGRHYRLSPKSRLAVGKHDQDNRRLMELAAADDILILTKDVPGPAGVLRGDPSEPDLEKALSIMASHVKRGGAVVQFQVKTESSERTMSASALPAPEPAPMRL
ncbi:MAG: tRNA 4-thiouridine(8) synthase ThiI [bacterium]